MSTGDPVSMAIVRTSVVSIAREVFQIFKRTALLPVIYEVNDFSVSVFDDRLNLIGDAPGLPEFVGSLDFVLGAVTSQFEGAEALRQGDVVIVNDPFLTGAHSSDVAVIVAAHNAGQPIGYLGIRAHIGDLGAKDSYPTDTTSMYEEGLIIPPVKLYVGGKMNNTIQHVVQANSRIPRETFGNLVAAGLALAGGAQRLSDLVDRYGLDAYREAVDQLIRRSDTEVRRKIQAIPDGLYEFIDQLDGSETDGDGVRLRVAVTVAGSEILIDTTGSAEQQSSPVNSPLPETVAACRLALKRLTTQDEFPTNSGDSYALTVVAPEGSIFNPRKPAPTYLMGWTAGRLGDMIVHALAASLPEMFPAQSGGDAVVVTGGHTHPVTGRSTFFADTPPPGYGATSSGDGMDALIHAPLAGTELTSTEIWETRLPIRKVSSALVTDSGGPGQWRGGLGTRIEWEFLDDMEMTLLAEKSRNSEAAGVHGGNASRTRNSIVINEGFPSSRTVGKLSGTRLRRGDRVAFVGGGGGGFGDPHARDPRLVLEDVVSGAVSAESARMQYGVAIEGSPPRLDPAATAQLRGPGMPYSPERQE